MGTAGCGWLWLDVTHVSASAGGGGGGGGHTWQVFLYVLSQHITGMSVITFLSGHIQIHR